MQAIDKQNRNSKLRTKEIVRLIWFLRSTFFLLHLRFCVLYPYNINSIFSLFLCILCKIHSHFILCDTHRKNTWPKNLIIRTESTDKKRKKNLELLRGKDRSSASSTKYAWLQKWVVMCVPFNLSKHYKLTPFSPSHMLKFRLSLRYFDWFYFLWFLFMRLVLY